MTYSTDPIPTDIAVPGMVCFACNASIPPSANFCPNCGKRLSTMPPSTSVLTQCVVYLVSFFLAPFGLWYGWKYLKQQDKKSKIIGAASAALTAVSLAISIWAAARLLTSISQVLKSFEGLGL